MISIINSGSFADMAKEIYNNNSKIIIFGVGVIGSTVTPEILKQYGLQECVECCVDNDKTRWSTSIQICGTSVLIMPPDNIKYYHNVVILITISRYMGVIEQLHQICDENLTCYIIPDMCIENFHNEGGKGVICSSYVPLIPKIIHYMWLGGKPISDNLLCCIESWKKYCPDYEIVRWDESNYDVHKNKFVSEAYDNKKYGFVPDYARLELLYEYGGIYLDTDVELRKSLDELLYQEAFCGVEKWQVLNFGGCSGAVKGHSSLLPFLESWRMRELVRYDGTIDNISSGLIDTSIAIRMGYKINGRNQCINGMNIYTYDYFHPYDYLSKKLEMTDDTFSIHRFNGGW